MSDVFSAAIVIFLIMDILDPFMQIFDTEYPLNTLFWWFVWIFVLLFRDDSGRRGG